MEEFNAKSKGVVFLSLSKDPKEKGENGIFSKGKKFWNATREVCEGLFDSAENGIGSIGFLIAPGRLVPNNCQRPGYKLHGSSVNRACDLLIGSLYAFETRLEGMTRTHVRPR